MRKPAVAGMFYEKDPAGLAAHLDALWPAPLPAQTACLGAMAPHAGYIYSGRVAAQVYARLEPADTYILLGPNHTGRGWPVAVAPAQDWETPLGRVTVDSDLAQSFLNRCPQAREDPVPHAQEHSLEVQLPFLQKAGKGFSIVPIVIGTWDLNVLKKIGNCLAEVIQSSDKRICLLASSDMNHFEDLERTRRLDHMALEKVLALDPEGLMKIVEAEDISMCGAGPAAAMLFAAKLLGGRTAELVDYGTSADASGDEDRVVGYAGVIIK